MHGFFFFYALWSTIIRKFENSAYAGRKVFSKLELSCTDVSKNDKCLGFPLCLDVNFFFQRNTFRKKTFTKDNDLIALDYM